MSLYAQYFVLPYEPLLDRAMHDCEFAETLQFFGMLATKPGWWLRDDDPVRQEAAELARRLVAERPRLLDRSFDTSRFYDVFDWLTSPRRDPATKYLLHPVERPHRHGRAHTWNPGDRAQRPAIADHAFSAVWGDERFPCGATAGQGIPLSFVRPPMASAIAEFIEDLLLDFRDDPGAVALAEAENGHKLYGQKLLDVIARYAMLYRSASDMNDCVLVVID